MRRAQFVLALLVVCPAIVRPVVAQQAGPSAKGQGLKAKDAPATPTAAPVIGCTSLANLRALRRDTGDDSAAARAVIHRPGSDLGCAEIDPTRVTAVADHLVLAGQAYDCLSLQGTAVCHWAPAGRLTPVAAPAAKPHPAERPKR